jgi:glycerol-1-phosphate dehydrogenase [NAD(P)+]
MSKILTTQIPLQDALKLADETKALKIGVDILKESGKFFSQQFPAKAAIIVADKNTFEAAGKEVFESFQKAGIRLEPNFIFSDPNLYADYKFVQELIVVLSKTLAIPVAVGSGVINDITKLASHRTDRRYMCIATAASMDGYTAFGASMTTNGAKQTLPCPAPQACLADIDVIKKAPSNLSASGYGDLFAKVTAGADWILADALGIEKIDMQAWNIVQGALHKSLADPKGLKDGNQKAVEDLITGLMMGGFAMQYFKSSRPASGAEHQFSHLWSMEHCTNASHGFQVAVGTVAVSKLYEKLINFEVDKLDIDECLKAWKSKDGFVKQARELFNNENFMDLCIREIQEKFIDAAQLKTQLETLKNNWADIKEKLINQVLPAKEVIERFKLLQTPFEPEQIGLTKQHLRKSFLRSMFIRRRFTVIDLCFRANLLERFID